ncbi:MAG: DUF3127 domain-containing protein [Flavobacteriales bacterium]|nr:DUF3127 domain-containing protein [Flavobacteriales bacterium]
MDLKGRIKVIMDEQRFESGFYKRDFVITTEEQYPQEVVFSLNKEKTEVLNTVKVGDQVVVHFDIRGREWQGRYFVNLVAWKMEVANDQAPQEQQGPPNVEALPTINPVDVNVEEEDDLPF